jgi:hypothetical protein
MPITGKTPIADLGDSGDADHRIDSLLQDQNLSSGVSARIEPSFGAAPAPSFGAAPMQQAVAPQQPQTNLTASAATAVAGGAESSVENTNTDWINKKWRPVMGWMYMMVCVCDFTVFPVLWSILQAVSHGSVTTQWQPLTLQGAGLFHVAMGAVLGIAAYGRTKEKVAGAA